MPELPEVETVRAGLAARLIGQEIKDIFWSGKKMRRALADGENNDAAQEKSLQKNWRGQKIRQVTRRAKYIVINGHDDGRVLLCHLGMSGFFRFVRHNDEEFGLLTHLLSDEKKLKHHMRAKHLHVLILLDNALVAFYDPRRFGFLSDVATDDLPHHPSLRTLGVEPMVATLDYLWGALQQYNLSLKSFLLNQKIIVGIGNIYAAEILWLAGLSPKKNCRKVKKPEAEKLLAAITVVLKTAIEKGGSSFSDFQNIDGELGYFASEWRAYGMAGKPCAQCAANKNSSAKARPAKAVIKKFVQNGRTTYYCPQHQK
ncbi:MAG: bifunctional DNA-formamidopyrimidine glycosylase/DNA-(apurinic or apyrimidinic site) lyase [Hydrotalea sp.]|nr:bifunctional DNA-formamidopyrimidine glycosylase/DNA-(apurinic or apyrimidinic site) lyase [Hydrotalea sp.]